MTALQTLAPEAITLRIATVRSQRVIVDADLAALYGVETKRFNEAVKRNLAKFPADFMFTLTAEEFAALRSQFATSNDQATTSPGRGGRRFDGGVGLPCAVGGGLAGGKRSEDGQRQGGVAKGRGGHAGNLAWMTRASCADPDSEHVQEVRRPAAKVALSRPGGAAIIAMKAPARRSGERWKPCPGWT